MTRSTRFEFGPDCFKCGCVSQFGIELAGRNLGDARFTAQTKGDLLTAHFESNAANAAISGDGTMQLDGDYPVNGKITFSDASLNSLMALAMKEEDATRLNFDGTAAGELTFSGPAKSPDLITASLNIPKVELRALPGSQWAQSLPNFVVTNSGAVRATLRNSVVRIESAHFKAPETDVALDGTVFARLAAPLNLHAAGHHQSGAGAHHQPGSGFNRCSGLECRLCAGGWTAPDITGRASMRNARIPLFRFLQRTDRSERRVYLQRNSRHDSIVHRTIGRRQS